jgi:starch synthase
VSVQVRYDEVMAHRLIAAADVILVPSRFEPCGLTQMYGLRYGTLPLVRRVGGLADTVIDADAAGVAADAANGFVFDEPQAAALAAAIERVVAAYRSPETWRRIQQSAMNRDHAWDVSARDYLALYRELLAEPA